MNNQMMPKDKAQSSHVETPMTEFASLRQNIIRYFSESELRDLCFDLEVDYENLPGQAKSDKVRELLLYLKRSGRIRELIAKCSQLRPNIPWDKSEVSRPDLQLAAGNVPQKEIVRGPADDYYLLCGSNLHRIYQEATLRDVGMAHELDLDRVRKLSPKELNLLTVSDDLPDTTPRIVQSQEDGKYYLIRRVVLNTQVATITTKREIQDSETVAALAGDIACKRLPQQEIADFKNDASIPEYYGTVAMTARPRLIGGTEWRHQYLLLGKVRRHIPFGVKLKVHRVIGEPDEWFSERLLDQEMLEGTPVQSVDWIIKLWEKRDTRV